MASENMSALRLALKPFADFYVRGAPDAHVITSGSAMAQRQLTMGDCRRAAECLSSPAPRGSVNEETASAWTAIDALISLVEEECTSEATEMQLDPDEGPWREADDEPVGHTSPDQGKTIIPLPMTFGHIRRARAAYALLASAAAFPTSKSGAGA